MEKLRGIAVWVAALYWVCCLAVHVVVAVTQTGPLPGAFFLYSFLLTGAVAVAVLNITKPPSKDAKEPALPWYIPALAVASLICGLWPWVVGSGAPNAPGLRFLFEDTGRQLAVGSLQLEGAALVVGAGGAWTRHGNLLSG